MNVLESFLTVTAMAYFASLPFKMTENFPPLEEKALMLIEGLAIIVTVHFFPNPWLYLIMSAYFTLLAGLSWLGTVVWRTADPETAVSQIHQVAMFAWNLLIAIAYMMRAC